MKINGFEITEQEKKFLAEFALEFLIRVGRTKKWVPAQSCLILVA